MAFPPQYTGYPEQAPPAPQVAYVPPPLKPEHFAILAIVIGAVLVGSGIIVVGTTSTDIRMGQGDYEGGFSDAYRSGYSSGFYDGEDDRKYDTYHGNSYSDYSYSGDGLRGYNRGYDDSYYNRANAMNDLRYHPDIRVGALQVGSVLAGVGTMLGGLGAAIRLKAHFDRVKKHLRM